MKRTKVVLANGIDNKKVKVIDANDIRKTLVIRSFKGGIVVIILSVVFLLFFLIVFVFNKDEVFLEYNNVGIKNIEVVKFDEGIGKVDISIIPSKEQSFCSVVKEEVSVEKLEFQKMVDGKCTVSIPLEKHFVYFKNKNDVISLGLVVNDYVVKLDMEDKYYLTLNNEKKLYNQLVVVGEPKVSFININDVVLVKEDTFTTKNLGTTTMQAIYNNEVIGETKIVVTDVIVPVPKEFDDSREYLGCEVFTSDEAALLDEILAYRIEEAGYGTRAGAVAAARFLTLEFPYKISYRWESGRLNNTGRHYVDGEGRYYHKGLYLDSSKYDDIEASLFGPAMWGCKMISYEDDPPHFKPGVKYPNGLDCSGFVTWSLYNGGFDVGDRGAGELESDGQLTDLGELKKLNTTLINSGQIKVGDLFNFFGHIAILIGEDEDNYYVAESLNNYKGVVIKTYSKKKIMNTFKYVVLMDDVYLEDGNLTDMWY